MADCQRNQLLRDSAQIGTMERVDFQPRHANTLGYYDDGLTKPPARFGGGHIIGRKPVVLKFSATD